MSLRHRSVAATIEANHAVLSVFGRLPILLVRSGQRSRNHCQKPTDIATCGSSPFTESLGPRAASRKQWSARSVLTQAERKPVFDGLPDRVVLSSKHDTVVTVPDERTTSLSPQSWFSPSHAARFACPGRHTRPLSPRSTADVSCPNSGHRHRWPGVSCRALKRRDVVVQR
jgi:hypothetical protein